MEAAGTPHLDYYSRTTVVGLALSPCGGSTQLQRETREPGRGPEIESNRARSSRERWYESGTSVKPPPRQHVGHVVVSTVDGSLIHASLQAAALRVGKILD